MATCRAPRWMNKFVSSALSSASSCTGKGTLCLPGGYFQVGSLVLSMRGPRLVNWRGFRSGADGKVGAILHALQHWQNRPSRRFRRMRLIPIILQWLLLGRLLLGCLLLCLRILRCLVLRD